MSPSSPTPQPVEDRLRSALAAEADAAGPLAGGDSLGDIRTRVRAGRRRRAAGLAAVAAGVVVVAAVAVPRLAHDAGVRTDDGPVATAPPSPSPSPNPVPAPADMVPVWPGPGGPTFTDPAAAARSFVRAAVGVADAPLSAVRADGTVDVLAADGRTAVSHLALRRDGAGHWSVLRATSDQVSIGSPAPPGAGAGPVASPVHVTGRAAGPLNVDVRTSAAVPQIVGTASASHAGTGRQPYAVDVGLAASPGGQGILVAQAEATGGGVPAFAAHAVVLPAAESRVPGLMLWPFASAAEASSASAAWHADPEQTALRFAHGYLGFSEIDTVTSRDVRGDEAWIGVGSHDPEAGRAREAAVLHLAQVGTGGVTAWEVVGSRDTSLTLETPRYGATVGPTFAVGGHITGVDESLRVQLHRLGAPGPVGESCCLPAGDVNTPWSTSVDVAPGTGPGVLTVVVSTGGHVAEVERFAITGVRLR
jgi:hypothetical protein